jgi:hypothetical protein
MYPGGGGGLGALGSAAAIGVSDPGAFVDTYPGGSFGAGPAPGGGAAVGISPSGVPAKFIGSLAWCHASRRKPSGPDPLP